MIRYWVVLLFCFLPLCAGAQARSFTLSAPPEIVETGILKHLLPRFALKHGIRVEVVADGGTAEIGLEGLPVFTGLGQVWHLSHSGTEEAQVFSDWLTSEIGSRTLDAFQPEGQALFSRYEPPVQVEAAAVIDGDPVLGERLSLRHCGRCHVINASNRMKGMGQAPSFGLMRTFDDWQTRFGAFYALNPHPSFTQIAGITAPFRADLPPAIVPLEMTQAEIDDILAYVASVPPADLGAPLHSQ